MSITVKDYLTASGSYPEREKHNEVNLANAERIVATVNALLKELGWTKPVKVSSGFRPAAVNAGIANAAKKSLHTQCLAIDLLDDKLQTLAKLCASKPELLRKYGLFLEDPSATIGKNSNWTHLDLASRSDRPSRIFKP
jgi:Peptidase M15